MGEIILIVEDDADTRDLLKEILEMEGYHPFTAADGEEALSLLERGLRPRVMLLDLLMPKKDGVSLLGAVRDDPRLAGLDVVITSATPVKPLKGTSAFLGKPFDLDDLLALLERVCETRHAWQAASAALVPG